MDTTIAPFAAARRGDIEAIQEWFSTGSRDINERHPRNSWTLLMEATGSHEGQIETMRFLVANGANLEAESLSGWTALFIATCNKYVNAAMFLLDHGAQVDARAKGVLTPLMFSALSGRDDVIRFLLYRGADLDARDEDGSNAEELARQEDSYDAAILLADVRRAGGWRGYVRYPRFRLLMLRILAEQGRAETKDDLLVRLFPAGPPATEDVKRPREAYRAQKGGSLPRGIFMHILGYWRSDRDYDPALRPPGAVAAPSEPETTKGE